MAQVSVTIDGKKYRLACNEGEESRLEQIAGLVDDKIGELRRSFGEIGDQRLTVMAALTFADQYIEARDAADAERSQAIAATLDGLGTRIEQLAARLAGGTEA